MRIHVHRGAHLRHLRPMLDNGRDRVGRKLVDEGTLPVGADAFRIEPVEGGVQRRVGQLPRPVRNDGSHVEERLQDSLGLLERAGPVHDGEGEGVAMSLFGDEGQRRRDLERGEAAELLGRILDELVEHGEQGGGVLDVVEDRAGEHLVHVMQTELQRSHEAEVAATTAQTPEQVCVLALAGGDELPVGGDHIGGDEVVDGESVCARQVADPAPERQSGHPGGGDDSARRRQSECVGGVVEVTPGGAGIRACRLAPRVHPNAAHR